MERIQYYLLPIFKVMLFCFFIFICAIPFLLLDEINLGSLSLMPPLALEILDQVAAVLMVVGALLMVFRVCKQYKFKHVFVVRNKIWTGFGRGTIIGFALVTSCSLLSMLNGNVAFTLGNTQVVLVFGYALLYILVGVVEELIFRSFPLLAFSERYPAAIAILITGCFFGLAHYFNPGFTWLAMLNISLVGILLAIYVLLKRNIYWAIGIHFGWNFTQGILLGYKVSGTAPDGLLIAKPLGPAYLSGGSFGIEGSIFCTLMTVVLIIYILMRSRITPIIEVEEQKFQEEAI
jgi:membrane protease YdiL (CAAX protease family)